MTADIITKNSDGTLNVPDMPTIPFIEGDGTGPDIWASTRRVIDAAVARCYGGSRAIQWLEILAGEIEVLLPGQTEWKTVRSGESFEVPPNTKFSMNVASLTDYCCSYG